MATFVVLPPRELLENAIHNCLRAHFPGFAIPAHAWETVVETVMTAQGEDVFPLHREDLSETDDVAASLLAGYGAEPGDQVLEVGLPRADYAAGVKSWPIRGAKVYAGSAVC